MPPQHFRDIATITHRSGACDLMKPPIIRKNYPLINELNEYHFREDSRENLFATRLGQDAAFFSSLMNSYELSGYELFRPDGRLLNEEF